jgi:aerobic-type carbon monoxide dehydrogenase small subunit (CoxS/CutS family)
VTRPDRPGIALEVDGRTVVVPDDDTLLDALRDHLGVRAPKDGCSPQGQCGCCTVLVDGAPRVACVTPVRRVAGRRITTLDGIEPEVRDRWAAAFCATGASQCGFCTPGILVRLIGLPARRGADRPTEAEVERALAAHLCRCTGWRTIVEADRLARAGGPAVAPAPGDGPVGAGADGLGGRDPAAAARRATLEGRAPQRVGPDVALGAAGFADDTAPADALVAVPDGAGGWALGATLAAARAAAGKVQGRRTTVDPDPPLDGPPGDWLVTLRTSWVEPAYLETDAAWCAPGGEPATPLANGGAFGGKVASEVGAVARRLADEHGRAVRVLLSREDTVRRGPKRPPIAAGVRADGTGVVRVVSTAGVADRLAAVAPGLEVHEVDVAGPPTSAALRGAGWVEGLVLLAGAAAASGAPAPAGPPTGPVAWAGVVDGGARAVVASPDGARAEATVADGEVRVRVRCGDPLDAVVLRSYCVGAAHQALSWVTSEGLAVAADGSPLDLTVRSFGVLRAADTPPVHVAVDDDDGEPVNGSDAVLAAVAAATWVAQGLPPAWPTGHTVGRRPSDHQEGTT